jgi:hypothetical protein
MHLFYGQFIRSLKFNVGLGGAFLIHASGARIPQIPRSLFRAASEPEKALFFVSNRLK